MKSAHLTSDRVGSSKIAHRVLQCLELKATMDGGTSCHPSQRSRPSDWDDAKAEAPLHEPSLFELYHARADTGSWRRFLSGASFLRDRHLRELSLRLGADILLAYGLNDYDKARALACVRYANGRPAETLLLGEDEDQDLMLDRLELPDEEIGDLDFDFEFDGRERAAEFFAGHGLDVRSAGGELERVDLLIRRSP